MLDSKKECKFPIIVILFIGILFFLFPGFIIIFLVIVFNGGINIEKILKNELFKECIFAKKILKLIEKHKKSSKNQKSKKYFYELILEQAKKDEKKEKNKLIDELGEIEEKNIKFEKPKIAPSKIIKKPYIKNSYTNKKKRVIKKSKENKYSFNGGKSIWDDYESIADKINKK